MVDAKEVKRQLQHIGSDFKVWGRSELRELPHVMFDSEQLHHVINGRYAGGFATLVTTDQRVLLIDKKPLYLTMEDIRYDMISDIMFNHRLLDANLILSTMNKNITFISFNPAKLRSLTNFVQQKVLEFRQKAHGMQPAAPTITTMAQPVAGQPVIENLMSPNQTTNVNPYKMPVIVRRRVSRFY